MKGPAIFLAQFAGDEAPFNSLDAITKYMGDLGYKGVQIPTWDARLFDVEKAAESQDYVDEVKGICAKNGVEVTELSTHLQGQLVASHPAYDKLFDGFAPAQFHGNVPARTEWAVEQLNLAAKASRRFGCTSHATFSGALMWHMVYPWPQRPAGLVEEAFAELGRRWKPILDVFDENGVNACYELHPGEDLHDGVTFERFLEAVGQHPRANILYDPSHFVLQQLDYLAFIDIYHERIKAFHVKDAEFRPNGRAGVYGSYSGWAERPGRFRSLGDGQIDFGGIFTKLTHYGYDGWAVLEWECAYKHPEQGAAEGAPFIAKHMIRKADKAFDDFAGAVVDKALLNEVLGSFEGIDMVSQSYGRKGDEYILNPEQIKQFHRDGYVTLRDVVTEEELAQLEPEFERFISGQIRGMSRDFCDMSGPYDREFEDFSLVNAVLPRKYEPKLRGNIYERRSASIARQLVGETATLDYDQFLAKRPGKPDAVFTWHQDLGYWPTGTPDPLTATCSLALDDANEENGCLRVVPGSQKGGLRPHRPLLGEDRESSHILSVELTPQDRIVELPLRRGDITVHDELIIHGSGGNRSKDRWRRTYIVAFRTKACVDFERSIGFTHSHNDTITWETHLGALTA